MPAWNVPMINLRLEIFHALKVWSLKLRNAWLSSGIEEMNHFQHKSSTHQLSCVWNIWPLTFPLHKPTVWGVSFIIRGFCYNQPGWSVAAGSCLLYHLQSHFNEKQIRYFYCCLNKTGTYDKCWSPGFHFFWSGRNTVSVTVGYT